VGEIAANSDTTATDRLFADRCRVVGRGTSSEFVDSELWVDPTWAVLALCWSRLHTQGYWRISRVSAAPARPTERLLDQSRPERIHRPISPRQGCQANRRMRTRTSGGVGGAGVSPAPTRFLALWCGAAGRFGRAYVDRWAGSSVTTRELKPRPVSVTSSGALPRRDSSARF
jgi:hypothetical protein